MVQDDPKAADPKDSNSDDNTTPAKTSAQALRQPQDDDASDIRLELDIGALLGGGLRQLVKTASQLNRDGATIAQRLRDLDGKVERREFRSDSGQRGVASIQLRSRFLDDSDGDDGADDGDEAKASSNVRAASSQSDSQDSQHPDDASATKKQDEHG